MLDGLLRDLRDAQAGMEQCRSAYKVVLPINLTRITADDEAIEAKLKRIGELSVQIPLGKKDLKDTQEDKPSIPPQP